MGKLRTILLGVVLLAAGLAGCIGSPGEDLAEQSTDDVGDLTTENGWSTPSEPRQYEVLSGFEATFDSFDDTEISNGVFLPEVPGCDWDSSDLSEECQLPVVIDAGPYWADGEEEKSFRPPLVEWLVPRGYAVVHMSVRGTGESGGCMEFMSEAEQRDVSETVTWAAEQAWSNGKVGMMGRSYDGTTPLMAAAQGNPHLETIVPISGVTSVPDLMFKNGTSESRGPIMHSVVYWALYGMGAVYGPDALDWRSEHWSEQACRELAVGQAEGGQATVTGDASSDYWQVRDFKQRILDNYDGSIWVVHGMQDWNVNPSQVVPFTHELRHEGFDTRVWLGQWDHAYPDRVDEHRNVRWDWADKTLEWFDYYLKDEGEQPWLGVEVEDSLYKWRREEAYPPHDANWTTYALGADGSLAEPGEADEGAFTLTGPPTGAAVSGSVAQNTGPHAVFTSEPLEEDLRVAGLPRLHVDFSPTTPAGGELFAKLYDVWPDGTEMRVGWAAMHLAHHDGGNDAPETLTPGETYTAEMQFEPMDAHVAKGHRLKLVIDKAGVEDLLPSKDPEPTRLVLGPDSTLELMTVDRPAGLDGYQPPGLQQADRADAPAR